MNEFTTEPNTAIEVEPYNEFAEEPTIDDPLRTLTALQLCELLGWQSGEV